MLSHPVVHITGGGSLFIITMISSGIYGGAMITTITTTTSNIRSIASFLEPVLSFSKGSKGDTKRFDCSLKIATLNKRATNVVVHYRFLHDDDDALSHCNKMVVVVVFFLALTD